MQRVLVLEKNQETADRLLTALRRIEDLSVSLVPTMREACLIITESPQDLAFVPVADGEQLRMILRSLQPELNMVLTTADPHLILSNNYRQSFQGLLHTPLLEEELPGIFSQAKLDLTAFKAGSSKREKRLPPSLARLREACSEIGIDYREEIQMVVLSATGHLIGYCGVGHEAQAYIVVELVSESWQRGHITAQIQFFQLPDYFDARLIYSRRVVGAVLSLVAAPDTAISQVRETADRLAGLLSGGNTAENRPAAVPASRRNGSRPEGRRPPTFAIAWRSVKPLPGRLQMVIERVLPDLAKADGCHIRYLSITPTIVHLVVSCPIGKTAAWVAYYLKSGVNEEIYRRFGVKSSIWRKGFYGVESDEPLKDAELKMLLTD